MISLTLLHHQDHGSGSKLREETVPVGWVNMHVFDGNGILVKGKHTLKMWPSLSEDDMARLDAGTLSFRLPIII